MPTPNHGYSTPPKGTQNWHTPLNNNFSAIDTDVIVRDTDANKSNYTPSSGAAFLATDTGIVYAGNGNSWNAILAVARYDSPVGDPGSVILGDPTNTKSASGAVITGGTGNEVAGKLGNISGGKNNKIKGFGATIGGGLGNEMGQTQSLYSVIAGGESNASFCEYGAIGGGQNNTTGIDNNSRTPGFGTVSGGQGNTASGTYATVSGGQNNTASANGATIPGGQNLSATGGWSFAAGRYADATATGAFAWGDATPNSVTANTNNQVVFQASGGMTIYSDSNLSAGVNLPSGSGTWSSVSASAAKENIHPVNKKEVLEGVRDLDTATWNYKEQDDDIRHMGPMAETFHDTFGLGGDRERIATVDADGVAFAAIQGLADRLDEENDQLRETVNKQAKQIDVQTDRIDSQTERIEALESENEELCEEVDALKADKEALRERLTAVEERIDSMDSDQPSPNQEMSVTRQEDSP